ncbi:YdcF family protein [Pleurocapsa sp. CCALA 161]|uniref:YdcF family protein n=1 Tax=Pleurocapsa sp. CCALA 161 TaxID=2107688 RepID=UPI000D065CD0|nr:YdcF family protein [Pleurocapsa sp. CCALA 161]PSB10951.1 YdcF family protein [Pleurocapsa sp. CCALA 161]
MKLSEIDVNNLSPSQITQILFGFVEDDKKQGDCIFTLGGRGIERVHKAVELFNLKRADYILFSGGSGYGKYTYPLSWTMRDNAVKLNVPEDKILVEDRSNHSKDGVIASLFTLEDKFGIHRIKNILVISTPWNYRRAMLTLKTYYPKWIKYTWCPANYKQHQPDNWWKYPEAHGYVMKEITNLVKYVREGQLMDVEVEI